MHIDSNATIAGLPSMVVRDFLRTASLFEWNIDYAAERLRVSRRRAHQALQELAALGYVEPGKCRDRGGPRYKRSLAGSTLAHASAARPLRRATAQRKLAEFLERVRRVNVNERYLYRVKKVFLFGSYLGDADRLNDVDVAVQLVPRYTDPDQRWALHQARTRDAIRGGRRFGNLSEETSWPETEVLLALKARSRAISLHTTEDAILERAEYEVVFEDGS